MGAGHGRDSDTPQTLLLPDPVLQMMQQGSELNCAQQLLRDVRNLCNNSQRVLSLQLPSSLLMPINHRTCRTAAAPSAVTAGVGLPLTCKLTTSSTPYLKNQRQLVSQEKHLFYLFLNFLRKFCIDTGEPKPAASSVPLSQFTSLGLSWGEVCRVRR